MKEKRLQFVLCYENALISKMEKDQYFRLLSDAPMTAFVQKEQFAQWLRNLFFLNEELHKKYHASDQALFYIIIDALITEGGEGLNHVDEVINSLEKYKNEINVDSKIKWYNDLRSGLLNIRSQLTEGEIEFIRYKRHTFCHIFQTGYNIQLLKNGNVKDTIFGKKIDELNKEFTNLYIKHGSDEAVSIYLTQKLYPTITALHNKLN